MTKISLRVLRIFVVPAIAVAALLLVTHGSRASHGLRRTDDTTSMTPVQLATIALTTAADNGDPSPTSITYVPVPSRAAAVQASSDGTVPASQAPQPVYLVTITGQFSMPDIGMPGSTADPRGSVINIVVDPTNGDTTDFNLSTVPADLSKFGTPTTFPPSVVMSAERRASRTEGRRIALRPKA